MTGMLVTAIPQAKTISSEVWLSAAPINPLGLSTSRNAAPAAKGTTLPIECDERRGPALPAPAMRLQGGSRAVHEEELPELVERSEHRRGRRVSGDELMCQIGTEESEQGRAQRQSGEDLARHPRLAQLHEEEAHGMDGDQQHAQGQQQVQRVAIAEAQARDHRENPLDPAFSRPRMTLPPTRLGLDLTS